MLAHDKPAAPILPPNVDLHQQQSPPDNLVERYEPDFFGVDRSIIGRASDDGQVQELKNNNPYKSSISAGQTQYFVFPKSAVLGPKSPTPSDIPSGLLSRSQEDSREAVDHGELRKRQGSATVFISLDTCSQPKPENSDPNGAPDQLKMYISTSKKNMKPDLNKNDIAVVVDGGHGQTSTDVHDDLYLTVQAPGKSASFAGNYTFEVALSIDDHYSYLSPPNHFFAALVDTGATNALLYASGNLTNLNAPLATVNGWISSAPFSLFVLDQKDISVLGLHNSLCALKPASQIAVPPANITSDTFQATDGSVRQRFFVQGLNGSSSYYATLGIDGNSTASGGGVVRGGGTIFNSTEFMTKKGALESLQANWLI